MAREREIEAKARRIAEVDETLSGWRSYLEEEIKNALIEAALNGSPAATTTATDQGFSASEEMSPASDEWTDQASMIADFEDRLASLRALLAEAKEALRPFVMNLGDNWACQPDNTIIGIGPNPYDLRISVTLGTMRCLSPLLAKIEKSIASLTPSPEDVRE